MKAYRSGVLCTSLNYKANDPRAQPTHIRGLSEPDVPVGNRKQRMVYEREKRSSEIPTSEWWTMRTMRWMLLLDWDFLTRDAAVLLVLMGTVARRSRIRPGEKTLSITSGGMSRHHVTRPTDLSVGMTGWSLHWSSSQSKCSLCMILFFTSGGMKFSIRRYLK
ncbi:hypothetical protein EYF80_004766 [Liparis tanakae]|uniref:Uncharacterized protein n=1 Tax=Liparis tanakae TaxID=230148 RepID=A0A4Z2J6J8_9TELE|nr:hypothetical protein EYF80_004766 [Liparis tanakae]